MKRHLGIIAIFFLICIPSTYAQDESEADPKVEKAWKVGGDASLNFSQVSLTNWAGGGNNSVAGTFLFKGFLNHKKNNLAWDNTLDLGYGLTKQGGYELAKSEDRMQFVTKLGYKASKNWYYSAMGDFRTQFSLGYKDPLVQEVVISDFMAPGYLQFSVGMDYKPSENLSLYISPLTSKLTFVMNDSLSNVGSFGVDPGDNVREEYGASVKFLARKDDIVKNINTYVRVDLFSNYRENPQNVDVDTEFGVELKVNKFINAVFTCNLVYDDDVKYVNDDGVEEGARLQVKQLFGAGLAFKF